MINKRIVIVALCALFMFGFSIVLSTGCDGSGTGIATGTNTNTGSGSNTNTSSATNTSGGSGGQTGTFTINIPVGGDQIRTIITAPDTGSAKPLMVWLHADGAIDTSEFVTFRGHATNDGWVVVQPYSPIAEKSWWRYGNNINAILTVVDHAKSSYNINLDRIYLAGFSGGATTTAVVGRAHGEVFAACGMHCGVASGTSTSTRKAPYYVYAGKQCFLYIQYGDPAERLRAAGHEVEFLLGEGGHLPYAPAFEANWEFFQTHTLN